MTDESRQRGLLLLWLGRSYSYSSSSLSPLPPLPPALAPPPLPPSPAPPTPAPPPPPTAACQSGEIDWLPWLACTWTSVHTSRLPPVCRCGRSRGPGGGECLTFPEWLRHPLVPGSARPFSDQASSGRYCDQLSGGKTWDDFVMGPDFCLFSAVVLGTALSFWYPQTDCEVRTDWLVSQWLWWSARPARPLWLWGEETVPPSPCAGQLVSTVRRQSCPQAVVVECRGNE